MLSLLLSLIVYQHFLSLMQCHDNDYKWLTAPSKEENMMGMNNHILHTCIKYKRYFIWYSWTYIK